MRIIQIVTVPQSLAFLSTHIDHQHARGFLVTVASAPGDQLTQFAESKKASVRAINMTRRVTPLRDLIALAQLWLLIRRVKPGVVHSHTPKGGLLGMIAAWLARTPVRIYTIRGLPLMSKTGLRRLVLKWTEWLSCKLSHQVLCVSHSLRDVVVAERVCSAGKIKTLVRGSGQGVDAAGRFNPEATKDARRRIRQILGIPQEAFAVGFMGRLVRDKGVRELVTAWQSLRTKFPSLHLLIAGEFESEDPVGSDVERALREDERIHLLGQITDTPSFYASLDVLALPTYREGFPNVLLEAAAMEIPAVATEVPGCIDAIEDGVTGTLVPVRDSEALADAVERYLLDPELRRRHGRVGRERVLHDFRPDVIFEAIYREYLRLLEEKGLPIPKPHAVRLPRKTAA